MHEFNDNAINEGRTKYPERIMSNCIMMSVDIWLENDYNGLRRGYVWKSIKSNGWSEWKQKYTHTHK